MARMVLIRRIDVSSAARVGAILSALITIVMGLPFLLLQALFVRSLSAGTPSGGFDAALFGGFTLFSVICGWLVFTVIAGVLGAIYFAVAAFLYNVTSGWVGGLRVDLLRVQTTYDNPFEEFDDEPRKRGYDT
jgi:hypothetical protein